MLILSFLLLLLSNSITLRRDKSILYSRATITIFAIAALITYDNLNFLFLNKCIGILGDLLYATVFYTFILLFALVHYTAKSIIGINFSWTIGLFFSYLFYLILGPIVYLILETVVTLRQPRFKRLYPFSTILHLGFILLNYFGRAISYIYLFTSMESPSPHSFANVPLQSASLPSNMPDEYRRLLAYKKQCKDELMEVNGALEDLKKAVRLERILSDKSQNRAMKEIINHYKEYFDEESGNSKQEGVLQIFNELKIDFDIRKAKYDKAKQSVEEFNPNSNSSILPIFAVNYSFCFLRNILPYINILLSLFSLVISIVFTFDLNIDFYVPYFLLDIRDSLQEFFVYEILWTLPTAIWSFYRLCKNTKRCFKVGKLIKDFIYNSSYIKRFILVIMILFCNIMIFYFFYPEEFLSIVNLLTSILF